MVLGNLLLDNSINDTGLVELSKTIYSGSRTKLESLSLRKCNITSDGLNIFSNIFNPISLPLLKSLSFASTEHRLIIR